MALRMRKTGTLRRPTVNSSGQAVVSGAGTSISLALWRRKLQQVVGGVGEVQTITAMAFVPSGTDVERRDWLTVAGEEFVVSEVVPAEDDRGRVDHIGLQLEDA